MPAFFKAFVGVVAGVLVLVLVIVVYRCISRARQKAIRHSTDRRLPLDVERTRTPTYTRPLPPVHDEAHSIRGSWIAVKGFLDASSLPRSHFTPSVTSSPPPHVGQDGSDIRDLAGRVSVTEGSTSDNHDTSSGVYAIDLEASSITETSDVVTDVPSISNTLSAQTNAQERADQTGTSDANPGPIAVANDGRAEDAEHTLLGGGSSATLMKDGCSAQERDSADHGAMCYKWRDCHVG
ncbi:hypothetical protein HYDPIDRAFT_171264 [Hydnomerulius pinastri MD-312]|uniref:Uncharacterized protein n=1 Tax=Hydnomerulius pinastri MD-312 TaxID=994086 RepID=A0A0C9VYI6_9AGAM|nr:hypothetical protein HYDPIDRAFT_171264 [Hydnomerulius pinastri MD-312]